ncbi:MAG: DUF1330 domain-containing protein [Thermoleophilia bacterium]|nr:DUF1330 domain-containing protein [Thermoleophilia bacterium]
MACYFMARIQVHDHESYRRYLRGTRPLLERFGARVLAADEGVTVLEGEWPADRTILIEFADEQTAKKWYASPEYQAIAEHRRGAATGDAVLVRGIGGQQ